MTLAVLFAAIAMFTKLENVRAAIAIILVSLPISLVLSFIIRRTDSKVSSLSISVLLTLGYLVPKVLFKSIRSQYIEYSFKILGPSEFLADILPEVLKALDSDR